METPAISGDLGMRMDNRLLALGASPPLDPRLLDRQRSFTDALGRHGVGASTVQGAAQERARRAAEQFVAGVFIQPVLRQMREQNHAAAPFGPTEAERALAPLMDAQLAERIVRSQRFGLVDRIARDMQRRAT